MSTKIEIPRSKTKSALPILFLLFISGLSFHAYISPESYDQEKIESMKIISMATAIVTLVFALVLSKKLLSKKPGLLIDEFGITDYSNATYTELIEWSDITGIKTVKNGPIKSIILMTDKPDKYLDKVKKTTRYSMSKVQRIHGTPFMLVTSRLNIKYEDMVSLITDEFEKAKQATGPNKVS